jgi:hypothetical protein
MITSVSVAARIWAKTNSIVILVVAIWGLMSDEIGWVVLFIGLALIFGFFVTSPLLIVISPLVKLSGALPYTRQSKMGWLIFFLFLIYWLIFIGLRLMTGDHYHGVKSKEEALFMLSIIVAQFIAVRTTRKSLFKFYEQVESSHD